VDIDTGGRSLASGRQGKVLAMPSSFHPLGYVKVPFGILYFQLFATVAVGLLYASIREAHPAAQANSQMQSALDAVRTTTPDCCVEVGTTLLIVSGLS
jgi:hypothetical protein